MMVELFSISYNFAFEDKEAGVYLWVAEDS